MAKKPESEKSVKIFEIGIGTLIKPQEGKPLHWWNKRHKFFEFELTREGPGNALYVAREFAKEFDIPGELDYSHGQYAVFENYFAGYYLLKSNREWTQIMAMPMMEVALHTKGKIGDKIRQFAEMIRGQDIDGKFLISRGDELARIIAENPGLNHGTFLELTSAAHGNKIDFSKYSQEQLVAEVGTTRGIQIAANTLSSIYLEEKDKEDTLEERVARKLRQLKT